MSILRAYVAVNCNQAIKGNIAIVMYEKTWGPRGPNRPDLTNTQYHICAIFTRNIFIFL